MTPSTRRRTTIQRHNKVTTERKQQLVDMPLDVLLEIFHFLEPVDLLYLSRTTKGLREFLLDRRKVSALWKNAITTKGLPPCPDYISLPAYTYLAFDPVCHGCSCPCETVHWELRMRCCPDCFPKMTTTIPPLPPSPAKYLELPKTTYHYEFDHSFSLDVTVSRYSWPWFRHSFSLSDLELAWSRKRPRNVKLEVFMAEQNAFWSSIREHARCCRDWEYVRLKEKAARLSHVRKERVKDIKDRLRELGWTDLALPFECDDFLQLPEVRKLEPLTPAELAEIQPQLISWAKKATKDLIWGYCISTFISVTPYLCSDAFLKVRPREIDVAMLPAVHSIFESAIGSGAPIVNLAQRFRHELPPAIKNWSLDAVRELEQLSRHQLGLPPLSKPSCLPWVTFQCKRCPRSVKCRRRFGFEEALSHRHLYIQKREHKLAINETSTRDKLATYYDTYPRNIEVLRVDVTISRRVENLIRRMGYNPSRVTDHRLRQSTVEVVCGLCPPDVATGMKFERALVHCLENHLSVEETNAWTRASSRK